MGLEVGVSLPVFLPHNGTMPDLPAAARHAEDIGLDAVWAGDHLSTGAPLIESTVALTAAATVTERIRLGFAVLQLALRQPAWAAKQIGSLQLLSGNRIVLGVGVGGEWPHEWRAAGVPLRERGRRTDALLDMLPGLLAGAPTRLTTEPGEPVATLAPAVPMPPLWIGGMSERALRRAVRVGADGWLGSLRTPDRLAADAATLTRFAQEAGAPVPALGMVVFVGGEGLVRYVSRSYGMPAERAAELVLNGSPGRLAERLDAYAAAGARHVVIGIVGADVRARYDQVAEARALLRA